MIPEVFVYEKYMQGYIPVSNYEEKVMTYFGEPVKGYHYTSMNVPAFKEEPFITTEDDYISRMNFALSYINRTTHMEEVMGTWTKFNTDLLEDDAFGKVINGSGFLKDKTEELTAGITDPLQKIAVISDYIKKNVEYDGDEDFLADPLKKILERKKGTVGDVNLLFASMLQKAGLETDMVLLSTRDHGIVRKQYPMRKQFNYAICAVRLADKVMLVDATEKYLPYDVLPARCINGQGLVISLKNHGWIDIVTKTKAKTAVNTEMVMDDNGELKGTLQYARDGYDAQRMRESYQKEGQEKYVADFIKTKQWKVEKSEFADVAEIAKQPKETHVVSINDRSTVAGDIIYLNPFVTSQIEENPFKSETRIYPVDFGNMTERIYICKIVIPEGYAVDELPKSKVIALPANAAKYLYNSVQIGNAVNITSTFQINRSSFSQAEYPNLKEFYNQVVAKQAEQIVVKKK
jgi:Transglutaminase-like superfamily